MCVNLDQALNKEWLVGNGIGGFASSTVSGVNTRRYHALLVAALKPPVERTVLFSNIDEDVEIDGRSYYLGANEYPDGKIQPDGFVHIEGFRLHDNIPTTTFRLGDHVIEKTVWMEHGHNTTYVHYTYAEGSGECHLVLHPMCNYRDYHSLTKGSLDWNFWVDTLPGGCKVTAYEGAASVWLTSSPVAQFTHTGVWYWNFVYRREGERGFDEKEDLYLPGVMRVTIEPGDSFTLIASAEPPEQTEPLLPNALQRERSRQAVLLKLANIPPEAEDADAADPTAPQEAFKAQLVRAADTFIVRRDLEGDGRVTQAPTILAGYHWFTDWGRDTMISLPGLALPTGRIAEANQILRTFALFIRDGLLPNNFPDAGTSPQYNTVDATLWLFHAVATLAENTGDYSTALELYPVMSDIIACHVRGTDYGIHVDPDDGLLCAGEEGVQLTWMDARAGDWVVTPRIGKPVEINALWYNSLLVMDKLGASLGSKSAKGEQPHPDFKALARQARDSFRWRFWYADGGYLYDVIDGPDGDDPSLRPNQLLAFSLNSDLVSKQQARQALSVVKRQLLTPYGLRTLSPQDPRYIGAYEGDGAERDGAYHQGTVWTWLLGPYFDAVRAIEGERAAQTEFGKILPALRSHLLDAGLGTISEIFDGNDPYAPRGCISQAWSVAEILRIMN